MRVVFLVDPDRLFTPNVLVNIFRYHISEFDYIGVGIVKNKKRLIKHVYRDFIRKINVFGFMGLLKVLVFLVQKNMLWLITKSKTYIPDIKKVCKIYGVEYFVLNDVNNGQSISMLKQKNIDIIISMQSQVFKEQILNLPRLGCINKHAALLPKYRGVWPIFWAMLNDEDHVGITIHWMTSNIDEGGIICQEKIPLHLNDTLYTLYEKAFLECPNLIIEALNGIKKDPVFRKENVKFSNAYYSFPKWTDHLDFINKGKRII